MQFPLTRREMLRRIGGGFGTLALAGMLQTSCKAASGAGGNPLALRQSHFPARAKRIIFLFMNGGPSHVDTFDPKPSLTKYNGQRPEALNKINTGRPRTSALMQSPFTFAKQGQS